VVQLVVVRSVFCRRFQPAEGPGRDTTSPNPLHPTKILEPKRSRNPHWLDRGETHGIAAKTKRKANVIMKRNNRNPATGHIKLLLAAAISLCFGTVAFPAEKEFKNIPVLINLHTNSGVTPETASNIVARASEILNQAGIKLTVVGVITDFSGHGTTDGGDTSPDHNDDVNALLGHGESELATNNATKGKGIKIDFLRNCAITPGGTNDSPGWSVHRRPVVVTGSGGATGPVADGTTVAHEICHILTLAGVGLIGQQDGTNVNSDPHGHAPEIPGPNGKGNIMAPSDYRTNTVITTNQVKEIDKEVTNHVAGVVRVNKDGSVSKVELQGGSAVFPEPQNPAYPGYYYPSGGRLVSVNGDDNVTGRIELETPLAPGASGSFSFALDTDDDPTTGVDVTPFLGIERIIEIDFDWPLTNAQPALSAMVWDLVFGNTYVLTNPPTITTEVLVGDVANLGPTTAAQTIWVTVPKDFLELPSQTVSNQPTVIPTGVFTTVNGTGAFIPAGDMFGFDLMQWSSVPQVSVFCRNLAARQFTWAASGLSPGTVFQLLVDEQGILFGTVPPSGQVHGGLLLDPSLSGALPHFVTVQDGTGLFGFSVTPPAPPRLAINLSGNGQLTVTWEKAMQPYTLEASASLGPSAQWQPVPGTATDVGDGQHFSLNLPVGSSQFFRLVGSSSH
jgi:hypothetical protein